MPSNVVRAIEKRIMNPQPPSVTCRSPERDGNLPFYVIVLPRRSLRGRMARCQTFNSNDENHASQSEINHPPPRMQGFLEARLRTTLALYGYFSDNSLLRSVKNRSCSSGDRARCAGARGVAADDAPPRANLAVDRRRQRRHRGAGNSAPDVDCFAESCGARMVNVLAETGAVRRSPPKFETVAFGEVNPPPRNPAASSLTA